jgi:hypothetical protein
MALQPVTERSMTVKPPPASSIAKPPRKRPRRPVALACGPIVYSTSAKAILAIKGWQQLTERKG